MPTAQAHAALAERNIACLQDLLSQGPKHPEWAVTIAFYVAVHRVEAHLAATQRHSDGHLQRNQTIKALDPRLHHFYRQLYDHSRYARYLVHVEAGKTYASIMPPQNIRAKVVDGWLATVERRLAELAAA